MRNLINVIDSKDRLKMSRYNLCRKLDEISGIDIYENYIKCKSIEELKDTELLEDKKEKTNK